MDRMGHAEPGTDLARRANRSKPLMLRDHFPCSRCGYDLIGAPVLSQCPECGAGVMTSIVTSDVPYALRLRALARPRQVAVGLALIAAGFVMALSALASPLGVRAIYQLNGLDPRPAPMLQFIADALLLLGTVLTVVGTWVVVPRADRLLQEEVTSPAILRWWQRLPMLRVAAAMGLLGGLANLLADPLDLPQRLGLLPDASMLVLLAWFLAAGFVAERSLSRLISVLGRRSRLFLEGAHARQSVDVLILAAGAAVIGRSATAFMHRSDAAEWIIIPRAVWLVGGALLLFATLYLAANCVWIIRALWCSRSATVVSR